MKIKKADPRDLAIDLLSRSTCAVQVAAVLADRNGIFAWGWNTSGPTGYGLHAEAMALRRANRRRLASATIYVASRRKSSGSIVIAKPCQDCAGLVKRVGAVRWRDKNGEWRS